MTPSPPVPQPVSQPVPTPAPAVVDGAAPAAADDTAPVTAIRWVEAERPEPGPGGASSVLLLLPDDLEAARTVQSAAQRAGLRPVRVRHGDAYAELTGEFTVRAGDADDLRRVLDRLGSPPETVLHAATFGAEADDLDAGFFSLHAVARLIAGSTIWPTLPKLLVVTSRSVDVTGGEPVVPANATAPALLRAFAAENPGLRAGTVDVGPRVDAAALAVELAAAVPAHWWRCGDAAAGCRSRRR